MLICRKSCGASGSSSMTVWQCSGCRHTWERKVMNGRMRGQSGGWSAQAFHDVLRDREVRGIWEALGSEEMDDIRDANMIADSSSTELPATRNFRVRTVIRVLIVRQVLLALTAS